MAFGILLFGIAFREKEPPKEGAKSKNKTKLNGTSVGVLAFQEKYPFELIPKVLRIGKNHSFVDK